MTTTRYDLGPAADQLARLVQGVPDDDLAAPTPCDDWSVADLLEHIIGLSEAFTAAAVKRPSSTPSAGLVPDRRMRVPLRLAELVAAWRHEDAWTGDAVAGGVSMPADQLGVVALHELVLHGWDLARATRQDFTVDESHAAACLTFAYTVSEPEQADSRRGLYGPVVAVTPEAPILYRLLGASGRRPSWAAGTTTPAEASPTFVLVPGAWMGGWVWQDIVDRLQGAGHPARTLTLTGLEPDAAPEDVAAVDLRQHVEDVIGELERDDLRDVVLVAHSYSGLVVGQVADRVPERIRHCVHVASFLPRGGRSLLDDWGDDKELRAQERQRVLDDAVWAPPPPEALTEISDLDPDARRRLGEGFVDHPGRTVLDPVVLSRPVTEQPLTFVATAAPGEEALLCQQATPPDCAVVAELRTLAPLPVPNRLRRPGQPSTTSSIAAQIRPTADPQLARRCSVAHGVDSLAITETSD